MNIANVYMSSLQHQAKIVSESQCDLEWLGLRPSRWRDFVGRNEELAMSFSQNSFEEEDMQDVRDSQTNFREDAACILDAGGADDCLALEVPEIERALSMLARDDISCSFKEELSKLLMLGFKMELETVGKIDLHELLANPSTGKPQIDCMQIESILHPC